MDRGERAMMDRVSSLPAKRVLEDGPEEPRAPCWRAPSPTLLLQKSSLMPRAISAWAMVW